MIEGLVPAQPVQSRFTGTRPEMFAILTRGYLAMIPTIGLYRFWLVTWKRRFYWSHTEVGGEALEYTGNARQLLIGFLIALAFFLPVYGIFFYLSTQGPTAALIGYSALGVLLWFFTGYAIYRGRDFRFSRTLWRGIRFDLKGSALGYATRRFLWSLAMLATLGLVYPWMGASLWRYRWRHSWYGDRRFAIAGTWRLVAGPYYAAYFLTLLAIAGTLGWIFGTGDLIEVDGVTLPGPVGWVLCFLAVLVFAFGLALYRTRAASRLLSTVSLGPATLGVAIPTGALFGQFVAYAVAVIALLVILVLTALIAIGGIYAIAAADGQTPDAAALVALFQSGTVNVALLIGVYLVVLGAFGLLAEIILAFGWWKLLANGATIADPDSLHSVRATEEDRALIGQGLADALNVGAY